MTEIDNTYITFPPKFYPFIEPRRYKCVYGGRGSAKSWSCARLLLFMGTQKPLRIMCLRETMTSIQDSVHQLLSDQIRLMNLEYFYEIEKSIIYGKNDPNREQCTQIRFAGLKTNIDSIRSAEAIDIAWLEECHDVSKMSLRTLIPTIRGSIKSGRPMDSELWFTWNPRFATDAVHQKFVTEGDEDALVIQMNYTDNPYFSNTALAREVEKLKERDYDEYLHVYGGACLSATSGAVLSKEIKKAEQEKRFRRVPFDPAAGVEVFFDLGWADSVVAIMAQKVPGGEIHIIDCIEGSQEPMSYYLNEIKERETQHNYRVRKYWLPWDAHAKQLGTGLSTEEIVRNAGNSVQIVPKANVADGIQAVRTIFPMLWFDAQNCADLISNLRMYRYAVNEKTVDGVPRLKQDPIHDHSSHFFDALRCMAMALRAPRIEQPRGNAGIHQPRQFGINSSNWMKNF